MRGRPLVELLVFVLAWCALGLPLWRLTQAGPPSAVAATAAAAVADEVVLAWATVRLAHPATAVTVRQGDAVLFQQASAELRAELEIPLRLDAGRAPVAVDVVWPPEVAQSVVELTLEPDGLPAQSQRLWGRGAASAVLEFRWNP